VQWPRAAKEALMTRLTLVLAAAVAMTTMGCGRHAGSSDPNDGGVEQVGGVQLLISSVPFNVGCVVINDAASRAISNSFTVTAGKSARLTIGNLPAGNNSFDAFAYPGACPVAAGSTATWATLSSTTVNILPGTITNLQLTLEQVGGANIGLQFGDGGATD
jgi:hypothetical protein